MTEEEKLKLKKVYSQRLRKIAKARSEPLIENIKEAFAGIPYPKDENLISTPEHRAECDECQEIYHFFVGKTWKETLNKESSGLLSHARSFFLPLAWQYYLPAYLIRLIRKNSFISSDLEPNEEPELTDWEKNRIKLLTSRQCNVIIKYLKIANELWQGDDYREARTLKALDYWKENYRNALAKEQNLNE
ncbi:MAG: DUF6714 family protein [Pyrinomonadaceae bacterium]